MRRFVYRENIKHYKQLLERTTDEAERQRIARLLAEEEAKATADLPPQKERKAM